MNRPRGRMLLLSVDSQWGGVYLHRGERSTRLCLGFLAVTWLRIPEWAFTRAIEMAIED
jgi:hypothetical protein